MIVYTLLAFTVICAIVSLYLLARGVGLPFRDGWHIALLGIASGTFIYLYGTWIYLTTYAKYVFGLAALATITIISITARRGHRKTGSFKQAMNIIIAAALCIMSVLYFTGTTGKPEKVQLAFPLKTGKYFILQGGKGLPANLFHYSYRGAVYAIDIVKLNRWGNRANTIFSSHLEDYNIFGDTIFSPCNGLIVRTRNENPDNIPPSRKRGPSNTNQVVIESDSYTVFMGHLQQNGVFVHEGDMVKQGQPVGLAGNSGFSLEPHLHIQVHKNTHAGLPWYREEPLYPEFDGKTYLLFETITPRRVHMVDTLQ